MTAETLVRLYNVGYLHRAVLGSPDWRVVHVEIDGEPKTMALSELEKILSDNIARLRIVLSQQKPVLINRSAQPYARAS